MAGCILVLRFSAMGDVAMVAPVLTQLSQQYPDQKLVVISRKLFKPFFEDIPNVTFHILEPKHLHKGLNGLFKLYNELLKYRPTAIADLHDNLRSRILCSFFRLSGIGIRRINKGRKEKKALTRQHDKIFKPLKPTVDRYADVFRHLGYPFNLNKALTKKLKPIPAVFKSHFASNTNQKIGIAPFAQHVYKVYPLNKMEEVIAAFKNANITFFILGGGEQERLIAHEWEQRYSHVVNVIDKISLKEELQLIANLNFMVSMDSSGMHLASLMGIPTISIWGPTHPYAGFLGFGQKEEDCIQIEHPSRPSSVYGNKPCMCDGVPCISLITPEMIIRKINQKLQHD